MPRGVWSSAPATPAAAAATDAASSVRLSSAASRLRGSAIPSSARNAAARVDGAAVLLVPSASSRWTARAPMTVNRATAPSCLTVRSEARSVSRASISLPEDALMTTPVTLKERGGPTNGPPHQHARRSERLLNLNHQGRAPIEAPGLFARVVELGLLLAVASCFEAAGRDAS